jgi:hypothetical protein
MADQHHDATISATVRYATWPGERAVCAVLSSPKHVADQWYLGDPETGRVSELRVFRFREWHGRRR